MPSTFTTIEIGRSALMASRRALDVHGHNIANAATPGYSRQEVLLEPLVQRNSLIEGASGVGVSVSGVVRSRDKFIDAVLRNEAAKKEAFTVQKDVLDHLQVIISEPSDASLRQAIDSFWAAWDELSSSPDSLAARSLVIERGNTLIDMFRHLGEQADSLTADIEKNIEAVIGKVNSLSSQVATLNIEISRALARKEPAADLLDKRDLLLDELTSLTGASVTYYDDGSCRVSLSGFPLVDGPKSYSLACTYTSSGTEFRWVDRAGNVETLPYVGGKLGGLKGSRDDTVLKFKNEVAALLKDIVHLVNSNHTGVWEDGTPCSEPFFEMDDLDPLATAKVSQVLLTDPTRLVASLSSPRDGLAAANIAQALASGEAGLKPPVETWTSIVGDAGIWGQRVQNGFATQELLVKELQNRKDSISGVSIDEEVTFLIRQQHAFNAASRLITVADEMLDTIVNRLGVVGR